MSESVDEEDRHDGIDPVDLRMGAVGRVFWKVDRGRLAFWGFGQADWPPALLGRVHLPSTAIPWPHQATRDSQELCCGCFNIPPCRCLPGLLHPPADARQVPRPGFTCVPIRGS